MSLLEEAIRIAVEAHRGQKDRGGHPYILHPLRMMCRMVTEPEQMVAALHDVVEDTDWTLEALRERGFPEDVLYAIDCLTKREGEPYDALIRRAQQNALAKAVKLADLADNMDVRHSGPLTEKDLERLNKYRRGWEMLTGSKP